MLKSRDQLRVFLFIAGGVVLLAIMAVVAGRACAPTPAPSPTEPPAPTETTASATAVPPTPTAIVLPNTAPILQPRRGVSNLYIEYILDASGSMLEQLPDGILKREAAKEYLIEHMLEFAPETHIGLRAYGHRLRWEEDEEESCRDIELIAPVEVGQMETMADWLGDFDTLGMTPLHASVEMALEDFDTAVPGRLNNIIMISDGNETCGGNPCQLVEEAKARGINFTIHVVGLHVDAPTRNQLSCIADKSGGVYYDVHTSDELGEALSAIHEDVREEEQVVSFAEATETAQPPTVTPRPTATPRATDTPRATNTPPPTSTPRPTATPRPTNTPGPTATPRPTNTPSPPPSSPTPQCARPTITAFKAEPPPQGSTARFTLRWTIEGADEAAIFGNPVDARSGTFDVWDDTTNYWVLWAKVAGTPDDCYIEKAIQVDPDAITPPGPGLSDVTVSQRDIQISVRDNQAIDGDRIDLFVNGNKVLSNYTLTSSPYPVAVRLNAGENNVTVTALNEGRSSPNTVEVRVSHVTKGDSIQISQGLLTGQSASFKIHAP